MHDNGDLISLKNILKMLILEYFNHIPHFDFYKWWMTCAVFLTNIHSATIDESSDIAEHPKQN